MPKPGRQAGRLAGKNPRRTYTHVSKPTERSDTMPWSEESQIRLGPFLERYTVEQAGRRAGRLAGRLAGGRVSGEARLAGRCTSRGS